MKNSERNRYIISIDSSSSAAKTSIIDLEGRVISSSSVPITLFREGDEIYEHDPEEIWNNQLISIGKALENIDLQLVVGMAITNQRETVMAWDSTTGKSICRAISWQDTRNGEFLEKYGDREDYFREKTGLKLNSYFSVSKIDWILKNTDCPRENLRIGTVDSWLIYKLTKHSVFATDITNASRTMLMNLREEKWDGDLLELFGIPEGILPEIFPCGHLYGYWEHGDLRIPICGVIGDQQAALFCGGYRPGTAKNTYGTGLFLMMSTGTTPDRMEGSITTVAWKMGAGQTTHYALECGSFIGGNYIKELHGNGYFNSFTIINGEYEELMYAKSKGRQIFTFGGTRWRDFLVGIDENERGERVLKGALAFIALIMNEMISLFRSRFRVEEIIVGGNLTNIEYLNKLQTSMSSVRLNRLDFDNNSALGAALLAFRFLGLMTGEEMDGFISGKLISCGKDDKFPILSNLIESLKPPKSGL